MTQVQVRPLQPQTLLGGRYRLEREIGRGGMAIVWLAKDLKLNREVAIKVLLPEVASRSAPSASIARSTLSRVESSQRSPRRRFGRVRGTAVLRDAVHHGRVAANVSTASGSWTCRTR